MAEISAESPPYWLASFQILNGDFPCTHLNSLCSSFDILFISWTENTKQNSKLRHWAG